jgi:hypothetical protein
MNTEDDDTKYAEIQRKAAEEQEQELAVMCELYDRFGEAYIQCIIKKA